MSNYYTMRDAKVKIAHELMNRGWEVLGYHADESDSMTDYYCPASWGGIATKNGFILVVDNSYAAERTPIKQYNPDACLSHEDQERIKKLEALTVERGATAGEESNAKALIEKIKLNIKDVEPYTITGYTVAHMANPGRCKWHIEKDGTIYDKGTGITKYSNVPDEWIFDINTMEFKDSYKTWSDGTERKLNEDEEKAVKDLKALILRWERIINSMSTMGDGTKETEEAGKEQQNNEKLIKVTEKITKKVLKMVEVTDRKNIQVGDYLTFSYHGGYWKVTEEYMQKGNWKGVTESRKAFNYERVGVASRGYQQLKNTQKYYNYEYQLLSSLEKGNVKIFELKEVEEVQEVEKWVRQSTKKTTVKKVKIKENNETPETKGDQNTDIIIMATMNLNEEKNGIEIRFSDKPDTNIRKEMKENGFRWGGINNNCWYAKQSENTIKFANKLINEINNANDIELHTEKENIKENNEKIAVDNTNNNSSDQDKIEEGYIYNCHFKEWNYTMNQIHEELKALNLNYIDMGNKVKIENVDYETMLKIEDLNNRNQSMLFIDLKEKATDSTVTDENNIININKYKEEKEEELNNMSILDKFENIEIENTDRISQEDKEYCINQQEQYKLAVAPILNCLNDLKDVTGVDIFKKDAYNSKSKNSFIDWYRMGDIKKVAEGLKDGFISGIVWHFTNKYNVTIDSKFASKYNFDVTYENILDEIFEQLGGFTFAEKETEEIKTALKHHTKYYREDGEKVKINKTKITISDYLYIDTSWQKWDGHAKVSYSSYGELRDLLKGLKHYGNNTASFEKEDQELMNILEKGNYIGEHYEIPYNKINTLKMFKNGKVELVFETSQDALNFAKEYLTLKIVA